MGREFDPRWVQQYIEAADRQMKRVKEEGLPPISADVRKALYVTAADLQMDRVYGVSRDISPNQIPVVDNRIAPVAKLPDSPLMPLPVRPIVLGE